MRTLLKLLRSTRLNGLTRASGILVFGLLFAGPLRAQTITTTSPLPGGTVGASYSQTLTTVPGCTSVCAWTVTSGSLPAGLALNPLSGEIAGTPTAAVDATFAVEFVDPSPGMATATFALTIAPPLVITTASLPAGTSGTSYAETLASSGGTASLTWSITAGSLPTGLSLTAATGAISGTPSADGTFNFTAGVADAAGATATQALSVLINPTLAITTGSLPAGTSGTAYAQTLASSGGTAPLTWSIAAGSLPTGLTLTAATGAIGGTPSVAGTFNFTAGVADAVGGTATQALSITINATLAITTASLPAGTSGTAYAQTLASSGGTAPLAWSITTGTLPTGLSLTPATGAISGTPTAAGTFNFTAGVTDAVGSGATQALSILINATLAITTASLPAGTSGTAYAQTLASSGGTAPLSWSITAGTLPTGLTLSPATGAISGTPTSVGIFNFTAGVGDAVGSTATQALSITINSTLVITTASLPAGTSGTAYAQTLASSGGTAPLTWSITAGTLPTGLTLSPATGAIGGTPAAAGIFNFTAGVGDAVGSTATQALSITINSTLVITTASLPAGTSGTAYAQTLARSGGTAPLTWSITAGSLPTGLSLTPATGAISGTPTAPGTSNFTAGVADAVGGTATQALSITINATLAITTASLPAGTSGTAYAQTLASSGGTAPLTWSITAGSLPTGLSLTPATGAISGTPTAAGTFNFTAGVGDAVGSTATQALSITINSTLAITTASLPAGTSGTAYAQTLASSGGTAPLSWSITTGTLPTGLTLSPATGTISGTPTAAGTFNFTAGVADAVGGTATQALSITINATLAIATASLPAGTSGTAYAQTLASSGGTAPLTWSITAGTLPTGLSLTSATGAISGTPTAPGTFNFTAGVADAVGGTATQALSIVINGTLAITTASLPAGTSGTAYAQTLASSGGTAPLTWSITAGTLPTGLTLSPATGAISGTPTSVGIFNFTAGVADAVGSTATQALSITINSTLVITTASLPASTSGTAYVQTLASGGGTAPLTWSITAGSLPTGLSLTPATGAISGTPTAPGTFNFTAGVADAVGGTATQALSIVINGTLAITTASLPAGTSGTAYAQTLASSGGTAPLTWSITTGTLPTGLTLSPATGAISGTPTAAGTSNFTAGVADAVGSSATQALSITINPTLAITTASLPAGTSGTAYAQTLASSGGTAPLTWSITAGTLPTGLSLNPATGAISGTPTAPGTFTFTAGIADAVGSTATKALSITINGVLSLTTVSLPAGTSGTAYAQTLASSGGTAPLTWSIAAGSLPTGLTLTAATGAIGGTPSAAGTFNFTAGVADSAGGTATQALSITINATLAITTASLPAGTSGTAYAQTLASSGGTAPLTWSITAGTLPTGLSLTATTGAISGTPTAAGTFNFTAGAADAVGTTATQALSIVINPILAITTSSLPGGTQDTAYSTTITRSGGTSPFTWSITAGALPTGLSLTAATGAISGTPTAAGTFNFTAGVADAAGSTATQALSILINPILAITTGSLPPGTSGTAYAQTLANSGGTSPFTWSITAGTLPTGLSLTATTGAITGTPTAAGTFNFTANIADTAGASATQALSIVINPTVAITTPSLTGGTQATVYSKTLTNSGGTSPFTWSITAGTLPTGLSLTAATGAISGTPSAVGAFNFTVGVADAVGSTDSRALSIGIAAAPNITTTSLPGGITGITYSVALTSTGGTAPLSWAIAIGALPAGLSLDGATGTLVGAPSAAGTSGFTVRVTDAAGATDTQALSITVAVPLGVTTISLPRGTAGTPYSTPLAATGGTTPYTWSVTNGSLPGGLTLDSNTGVISGTPNTVGTANFLVHVVDGGNPTQTVDQPLSIAISPALSITTSSPLGSGMAGVAYSQTLTATGGTAPYNWTVTAGDLPAGLSLIASTGVISGTASVTGTFNLTIQVSDSGGSLPASKLFTIVIDPVPVVIPPLTISTSGALAPGTLGLEYSQSLNATGGILPYSWSLIGGAIPAGVSLTPGGVLNGTPTVSGTFSFTVRITDNSGPAQADTKSMSLTIVPALAILTASLPPATVGVFYSTTLVPAGGTLPYVWSLSSGSLPAGLNLNPGTGIISGTPVAPVVSFVGITLTDNNQPPPGLTKSQTYALAVRLPEMDTSLSATLQPAQQTPLTMALRSAIASALSGQLTLSFAASGAFSADDPMVQFSNGQRTVAFTIAPNSTAAVFSSPIQLLTGTVSGTITFTVSFQGGPTNQQAGAVVQVPLDAPQITSVAATQSGTAMTVRIVGYSTPRSVTDVAFRFDVRTASGVQRVDLTRNVNPDFVSWYENVQSIPFGSAFVFSQIFNVQANGATVEAVTITLTNAQGSSSSSRTLVTPQ